MRNKKVLVTGGAGYIGSVTVQKLIETGVQVVVIDNLSKGRKELVHKKAKLYIVDITNFIELEKVFKEHKFDLVMHFAAYKLVEESMENAVKYSDNIQGAINILNCMVQYKVPKIIYSSTAAVYGVSQNSSGVVTEEAPTCPISFYGYTKYAVEETIAWYHKIHNIKYINLRYFNVAGDGGLLYIDSETKNIFSIIMEALCNLRESVTIFGNDYDTVDGTCVRDYIHILDLADAHILATKSDFTGNINLGTNRGFSVKELIEKFEQVTKKKIKVKYGKRREGDIAISVASNEKAKKQLNWQNRCSLKDIIKSLLKAYERDLRT